MIEAAAKRVHIIQGEYKVVSDPDVVLTTILGSCVAACLRDPVSGVGGMNHFMQFLKDEGIPVLSSSTGGDHGRKIEFWPVSGRARQHPLSGAETQKTVAMETRPVPAPKPVANDIEFF